MAEATSLERIMAAPLMSPFSAVYTLAHLMSQLRVRPEPAGLRLAPKLGSRRIPEVHPAAARRRRDEALKLRAGEHMKGVKRGEGARDRGPESAAKEAAGAEPADELPVFSSRPVSAPAGRAASPLLVRPPKIRRTHGGAGNVRAALAALDGDAGDAGDPQLVVPLACRPVR
jgi:hypothetical protein